MLDDFKIHIINKEYVITKELFNTGQQYKGIFNCLKQSVASEGYSCLFRGVGSTVIRAFPTNAATMGVVTWIMKTFSEEQEVSKNSARGHYVPNNYPVSSIFCFHQSDQKLKIQLFYMFIFCKKK